MAGTHGSTTPTLYVTHPSTFGHAAWDYCRHGHHTDLASAVACAAITGGEVGAACRCGGPMPCALGHTTVAVVRRALVPSTPIGAAPVSVKVRSAGCPACGLDGGLMAGADGHGSATCRCGHEQVVDGVDVIAVEIDGADQASVIS